MLTHPVLDSPVSSDFKEANLSDLVLYMIGLILDTIKKDWTQDTFEEGGRDHFSRRSDGGNRGISCGGEGAIAEHKSMLIIKAKRASMEQAMTQVLLEMKDARDSNAGGLVKAGDD